MKVTFGGSFAATQAQSGRKKDADTYCADRNDASTAWTFSLLSP